MAESKNGSERDEKDLNRHGSVSVVGTEVYYNHYGVGIMTDPVHHGLWLNCSCSVFATGLGCLFLLIGLGAGVAIFGPGAAIMGGVSTAKTVCAVSMGSSFLFFGASYLARKCEAPPLSRDSSSTHSMSASSDQQ
jgi:hypothetical protein